MRARVAEYGLPTPAAEKAASALFTARTDPMADASFPAMRARSRPGMAMAAMMPMMATTISSSMRVKPLLVRMLMM